jgi:hypothetical protein
VPLVLSDGDAMRLNSCRLAWRMRGMVRSEELVDLALTCLPT